MPAEQFIFSAVKKKLHINRKGLIVLRNPKLRAEHNLSQLKEEGIPYDINENMHAAYCGSSITNTPETLKPTQSKWQKILLSILSEAEIFGYDTLTAPEASPSFFPEQVYPIDKQRIVRAKIFTFINVFPSTGLGVEEEIARDYNKIAVVLHKKNIRVSSMQPGCAIHLEFESLEKQRDRFVEAYKFIDKFEPGQGFDSQSNPILLGFRKERVYNLPQLVYAFFPDLMYKYNPNSQIPKFEVINPEIFT